MSIDTFYEYMGTHISIFVYYVYGHTYSQVIQYQCKVEKELAFFATPLSKKKEGAAMSEEKKSKYTGQTDARRKASAKYLKESVEDIRIRVPKGDKSKVQEHAASMGESTNAFVVRAINETMERDTHKQC